MSTQRHILVALNWFDERLFNGITKYAGEHNWHLTTDMIFSGGVLHGWKGDGVIAASGEDLRPFIESLDIPKVDITRYPLKEPVPRVLVDNSAIGHLAADHLMGCGFRNFAFYGNPTAWPHEERKQHFVDALAAAGLDPDAVTEIHRPPVSMFSDWQLYMEQLGEQVSALPKPVGIFAAFDRQGSTLIEVCRALDLEVPERVAVVGVDNVGYICEHLPVPMSSIDTRHEEVGYLAAKQLDLLIDGAIDANEAVLEVAPAGVVRRQSTDVVAVAHAGVSKAVKFIRDCYEKPITMQEISRIAGLTSRGLNKAFLRHLGRTPAAELRRVRLNEAARLLAESDHKIEIVARLCGYSNSSNLGVPFKDRFGMAPRAYRREFNPDVN